MSNLTKQLFNQLLMKKLENELMTYYDNYKEFISKEEYTKLIQTKIKEKFNFKIVEPSQIRILKNLYEKKYNKRPKGKKANDIEWLKLQLNIEDIEDIEDVKDNKYKPRYVSRKHFSKKKDKCMARLWNDHYGGQCSHTKVKGDYCNVHNKILIKYDRLQFGRIDEPKPERDYFNNNKLNWR